MGYYRGQDIPPVSDYAHWNEEAQLIWYQENRYDMEHADEYVPDEDDFYPAWEEPVSQCSYCREEGMTEQECVDGDCWNEVNGETSGCGDCHALVAGD